jgi:hypothetical protein
MTRPRDFRPADTNFKLGFASRLLATRPQPERMLLYRRHLALY